MSWIFELPNWFQCLLVMSLIVGGSLVGQVLLQKPIRRFFSQTLDDHNEAVGAFIQAYGVFYGITLGLVAVAAWENYEKCCDLVEYEATAFGAFARDISVLPEPLSGEIAIELEKYLDHLIEHAWSESQAGINPPKTVFRLRTIHHRLAQFQPRDARETVLFHEALDQLNSWTEKRSIRIASLDTGLPAILWWILILGAVLNILMLYTVRIEPLRSHLILTSMIACFIGLMIFLILIMDHPYVGDFRVEPDAFKMLKSFWKASQAG